MADITVTAANVQLESNTRPKVKQASEALTQGEAVYLVSATGKYALCDNDASATAVFAGIVLTPAATDDYFAMADSGSVNIGGTLVAATEYCVSATAGGIAPAADILLDATALYSRIGYASATDTLVIDILNSGVAVA